MLLVLGGVKAAYANNPVSEAISNYDMTLIVIASLLTLLVGFGILRKLMRLRLAIQHGYAGSELQSRVVKTFTLVTIIPTIVISLFSIFFFYVGIQDWFNERITTVLDESVAVAEAYLEEHRSNLRGDAQAMAHDLQRDVHLSLANPAVFSQILNGQVALRSLNEAVLLQQKRVVARSLLSFSLNFDSLPDNVMAQAQQGEVVITERDDRLFAVVALDPLLESYLVISRLVDSDVLEHLESSRGAADDYRALKASISQFQIVFVIAFVLITLVLLFSIILYGMEFASRLTTPLTTVAQATERVRAGDYSIQIEEESGNEEMDRLIHHFNRMTEQLNRQRLELTQANRMLDQRRRFSETVLRGVSAGVIALDTTLAVGLCNDSALNLLGYADEKELVGRSLRSIVPELTVFLSRVLKQPGEVHQDQVTIKKLEKTLTLQVKVSAEISHKYVEGFIVTLDDITPLISAQRSAAWADVARRVAHEIKNPLTPIKLSVSRLTKKFKPDDAEGAENFDRYIDTISRHLTDIGAIVEEFSSFARMPAPSFQEVLLKPMLEKAIFSAETTYPEIEFCLYPSDANQMLICDEGQISQILTNLLKNAAESIERRDNINNKGRIEVEYHTYQGSVMLNFHDNGVGFPEELIHKIMEPYVTTRAKGTGLGLAIVKKIIEDHKGTISLANAEQGGAVISIMFPNNIALAKNKN